MRATKRQTEAVRAYVEREAHEKVIHLVRQQPFGAVTWC